MTKRIELLEELRDITIEELKEVSEDKLLRTKSKEGFELEFAELREKLVGIEMWINELKEVNEIKLINIKREW